MTTKLIAGALAALTVAGSAAVVAAPSAAEAQPYYGRHYYGYGYGYGWRRHYRPRPYGYYGPRYGYRPRYYGPRYAYRHGYRHRW